MKDQKLFNVLDLSTYCYDWKIYDYNEEPLSTYPLYLPWEKHTLTTTWFMCQCGFDEGRYSTGINRQGKVGRRGIRPGGALSGAVEGRCNECRNRTFLHSIGNTIGNAYSHSEPRERFASWLPNRQLLWVLSGNTEPRVCVYRYPVKKYQMMQKYITRLRLNSIGRFWIITSCPGQFRRTKRILRRK